MVTDTAIDAADGGQIIAKWGEAARAGYQAVPDLLLKHQDSLNLNPTELVVLLNVLMHWWYSHQKPFPRPTTIARRMGSTVRTVQRAIMKLESEGLLVRRINAKKIAELDPEPLVQKLCAFAKNDRDYIVRAGGFVA